MRCVKVVIGESDGFRLYGSENCVIPRIVLFCMTEESFSGVLRMGDVFSIGGGLCADLSSACLL